MAGRVESVQARERLNDNEKEDVNVTGCESSCLARDDDHEFDGASSH